MLTYTNPVWPGYMADPFALCWQGRYYAYGTGNSRGDGFIDDGKIFPLLRSDDLAHWESLGGALQPLPATEGFPYWAPAVAEHNGIFYLYYSVDGVEGRLHHLRVATASQPEGPFVDTGHVLFPDLLFSIDAHPFRDPHTGRWFLFFAHELMDGPNPGTAVAVAAMEDDLVTPVGPIVTILRGSANWQIHWYDVVKYGRRFAQWYTIEGPCVVEHAGRYYCFYSGGAWENESYGVSYAVADHPLGPYHDAGSQEGPRILRTIPGKVIGPGHNTVIREKNGKHDFIVYHAWGLDRTARRMCIDRLEWTPEGPFCAGATSTPQSLADLGM